MDEVMTYTVDEHFAGKDPVVRELYQQLLAMLRSFGPVAEDPKKTSIHLVNRSALGGVSTRKDYILLQFKTDYPIASPRLSKTEQVSRNRYHHTLKVESLAALDGEVQGWLADAHRLSA